MNFDAWTVTVTTAGTRVQLTAPTLGTRARRISFQARPANTGTYVYVGRSDVSSTEGWALTKNSANPELSTLTLDFGQGSVLISDFYVDADTNGDRVEVIALLV